MYYRLCNIYHTLRSWINHTVSLLKKEQTIYFHTEFLAVCKHWLPLPLPNIFNVNISPSFLSMALGLCQMHLSSSSTQDTEPTFFSSNIFLKTDANISNKLQLYQVRCKYFKSAAYIFHQKQILATDISKTTSRKPILRKTLS